MPIKIDGKVYDSLSEAEKLTNISRTYIKKCIEKNISITKEGYEHYKKIHGPKKIEINGITFNSLKEASRFTGHSTKYLKKVYLSGEHNPEPLPEPSTTHPVAPQSLL